MKRCPTCDQLLTEPSDDLHKNLFMWTAATVFMWAIWLSVAEWTTSWWLARWHLASILLIPAVVSVFYWVRFVRAKSCPARPDGFEPVRAPPPPPLATNGPHEKRRGADADRAKH